MARGIEVQTHGPIFQPAIWAIVHDYLRAVKDEVAHVAEERLNMVGRGFFRYESKPPTGMWSAGIRTDIVAEDRIISDNVVYNAWLEGVSERNQSTRFKGYRIWRLTTQDVNFVKYATAERVLVQGGFLEAMNGL